MAESVDDPPAARASSCAFCAISRACCECSASLAANWRLARVGRRLRGGGAGGGPLGGEGSDEEVVDGAVEVELGEVLRMWLLLLVVLVVLLKAGRGEREFGWVVMVVNWTDESQSRNFKMNAEKSGKRFEVRSNESEGADESR